MIPRPFLFKRGHIPTIYDTFSSPPLTNLLTYVLRWDFEILHTGFVKLLMGLMPRLGAVARWVNSISLCRALSRETERMNGVLLVCACQQIQSCSGLGTASCPSKMDTRKFWLGQKWLAHQILASLRCYLVNCCSVSLSRCFPHPLAWPSGSSHDHILPIFWSLPMCLGLEFVRQSALSPGASSCGTASC